MSGKSSEYERLSEDSSWNFDSVWFISSKVNLVAKVLPSNLYMYCDGRSKRIGGARLLFKSSEWYQIDSNNQWVTQAHLGPIYYHLQTSPIPQTSFLLETFFAVFYSKPALGRHRAPDLSKCYFLQGRTKICSKVPISYFNRPKRPSW